MKNHLIVPVVIALLAITILDTYAWVEPDQLPPNGNIAAPLNTGSSAQSKIGGLILNIGNALYGLIVKNGNSGFGTETPSERVDVNGNIKLNGKIIGLQAPTDANDAVNKGYVDAIIGQGGGGGPMYDNKIVDMVPPNAYSEICFKNGQTLYDKHDGSSTTQGGNCVPGDRGYVIEKNRRSASFIEAKATCTSNDMRLPEPFEWQYACSHKNEANIGDILDSGYEWASNIPSMEVVQYNRYFTGAPVIGNGTCYLSYYGVITADNGGGYPWQYAYRCVR